jgi:acyl-CoA synthetase
MMSLNHDPNLAIAFEAQALADPQALALVIDDKHWTRAQLAELAARATGLLVSAGIKPGDKIVAQYNTRAEDIAMALAAARLGGTFLPLPHGVGVREVNYILDRSQAAFFCHAGEAPPEGVVAPGTARISSAAAVLSAEPVEAPAVQMGADHVSLIGVTSGSTGQPKGVMHSWSGVAWAAEHMRSFADVRNGEPILVTGAGAGAPGFTFFTYLGMAYGVPLVHAGHWNPAQVLKLAHTHQCVWSTMVPTMLQMLIDARPQVLGDARLEHMRAVTVGGAFMSQELIQRARDELGMEILRMYAMAECMSHSSMLLTDSQQQRDTLDGRPGPGAELAVFDDAGARLTDGEVGEVGMRGPSLLKGYLADPQGKSRLMSADGFFLSGDLGKITPEGFVKIVGRKKDMINRGGYKIDPSEVEELLKSHPAVSKVAVVGYPDSLYGERACAVVEPLADASLSFAELFEFLLAQGLSKAKIPERLECWDALPLSPDGKILKGKIRADIELSMLPS